MANFPKKYAPRLLTAVSVWVIFHVAALAETQAPLHGASLTTHAPVITAAKSTHNSEALAFVDTLPNRSQLGDGSTPSFPAKYIRSRFLLDQNYQPLTNVPGSCTDSQGNPRPWAVQFHDDAGHSIINSTGTRYLQFLLVTCGVSDAPNQPDVGHTAQTWYRSSKDSGVTFGPFKQLIASGFTPSNPLTGVLVGTNGYQFPGNSLVIPSNQEHDVLIPLEIISPLDQNNQPINPNPPYVVTSYSGVRVLRGHWRSDGSDLDWEVGAMAEMALTPQTQSTRGLDETAIVEMATRGRCIIVSRGSNQNGNFDRGEASIESHYWLFESQDGCRTWVGPGSALGWDDGSKYFAPAAPPFLFKDRNNRVIFMGANSDANSTGDMPRTRVVAAQLGLSQLKLLKNTAVIVDEKYGFDSDQVDLIYSNYFYPQNTGSVFYYTYRLDYGRPCADGTQNCYPHNWHLLNPIPDAKAGFAISADPMIANRVDWPAVPKTQTFIVYARNPLHQGFWELQGSARGSAKGYLLQSLPPNGLPPDSDVQVIVFAKNPNGVLTSSGQMTIHIH